MVPRYVLPCGFGRVGSFLQRQEKDARRDCTGHLRNTTLAAEAVHQPSVKFVSPELAIAFASLPS
jgi:hypothetical protein